MVSLDLDVKVIISFSSSHLYYSFYNDNNNNLVYITSRHKDDGEKG